MSSGSEELEGLEVAMSWILFEFIFKVILFYGFFDGKSNFITKERDLHL